MTEPTFDELQAQRDELDRRAQELAEREQALEQSSTPAETTAPDSLDREFAARSPGTRKSGRNPWVMLGLLALCAAAMYFVIAAEKPSKKSPEDEQPATYETARARAKIVPGKEEEPPTPKIVEPDPYDAEPVAPTREDLERRKELEDKRRQAEALRLARLKSAILIAGSQGSAWPAGTPQLTGRGSIEVGDANLVGAGQLLTATGDATFPGAGINVLSADSAAEAPAPLALNTRSDSASSDPNERFLAEKSNLNRASARATRLANLAFTVLQGKLIDCVLETAIQSDLPGQLRCSTSNDVYAESGRGVMLPAKTRMIGQYNSAVRKGQVRVFVIWQRAITPTGIDIQLDSPGTDTLGRAGIGGEVDNHYLEIFGISAMLSIIGAGASSYGISGADQPNSAATYRQAIQQSFAQTAQQILSPYAQIAPTIHVNQGEAIKIFVNRDLDFTNVYATPAKASQPYTVIQ